MLSEIDEMQVKRNYLQKLEEAQVLLQDLYDFKEVSRIRSLHDPYMFTENLDIFLEQLENEIEYQEDKLNAQEVIIYNKVVNN